MEQMNCELCEYDVSMRVNETGSEYDHEWLIRVKWINDEWVMFECDDR